MKNITLGTTGITIPQNAFGALPIQRVAMNTAVQILRKALAGGMRFFDTGRTYTDSEDKLGAAFSDRWDEVYVASKTPARTPEEFWKDLNATLSALKKEYLDLYQFHRADQCYRPGDGSGMYECMLEARAQGKIWHIGVTAHKIQVAMDCVESGLYETMQFPFSYLSGEKEVALVQACKQANVGFIAMKGLAGGLIHNAKAAIAFMLQFDNVLPIWGIQRESELEQWLSFMDNPPAMDAELEAFIERERQELSGEFCRGCGYCMPCPQGIQINQAARMSLLLRRSPSESLLESTMQAEMEKINTCINCRACTKKCPYELSIPELLKKNYADYRKVLAGEISVR